MKRKDHTNQERTVQQELSAVELDLLAIKRRKAELDVEEAKTYVQRLNAGGGTNIDAGLKLALAMNPGEENRPFFVIFITDGRPTSGVTDANTIIENARSVLKQNARIFNFGIGRDLNHFLLRQLAREHVPDVECIGLLNGAVAHRCHHRIVPQVSQRLVPQLAHRCLPDAYDIDLSQDESLQNG